MRDFAGQKPDYEGDQNAEDKDRRPLRKIFEGLVRSGERIDGVALLGTTNEHQPGADPFFAYAKEMGKRLTADGGLCGRRFEVGRVTVEAVAEPTMEATEQAVAGLLADKPPAGCLVTTGSGAYAMSVGAVLACVEAGIPLRLLHIDMAETPYDIAAPRDTDAYLKDWLIRHRFWDALAELDPDHRTIWQLLAARQRADRSVARRFERTGGPGVTPVQARKLAKLWQSVQAAMFERLGRGEAIDHGLLRAWYTETLSRRFTKERDSLPPELPHHVIDLLRQLESGFEGALAGEIRAAGHAVPTGTTESRVVRMLRDHRLTEIYTNAATHNAHLSGEAPGPLPPTIIEAVDEWEAPDVAPEMITQAGYTAWPVLGSGDVLALMAVGLDRDGRDEDDRHAIHAVLQELQTRRQRLPRPGRIRLRLLASEETTVRAQALASWARSSLDRLDGEAEVIHPLPVGPGDIGELRHTIVAALRDVAQPTGRFGSGSLRDVDEIVLVLNPGTAAANYGLIAAGVDWALEAACPFVMIELARRVGLPPEMRAGRPILCRLGADRVLAHLTAGALRRLDIRTAARLLSLGSSELRTLRQEVEQFSVAMFAAPGYGMDRRGRLDMARRRWRLIAHVLGNHVEPAAYLAVESVRPSLFSRTAWKRMADNIPAVRTLTQIRDDSPFGHRLDRQRAGQNKRPLGDDVRSLLDQAVTALRIVDQTPDDELIATYERLVGELDRLSSQTG